MDHRKILADKIGCEPTGVPDALFPISKGFTETERIDNMTAIYAAMGQVETNMKNKIEKSDDN